MMPPVPAPAVAAPRCPWRRRTPGRGRIPTLSRRSGARLAAPVHGHEETGVGPEDAAGRRLAPGGHAADRPGSGHAAAARRDEPEPGEAAGAPQAGPTLERSLNPSTQATTNAVPGRAWPRKKPTPPSISRSPASIARPRPANPSTPPSRPGRLPSLRRDRASALSRQRRSVSGATPGSLAVCSTALASDEHEPRASANSPTAFALNSGVYPAPFDMVPSSPIELGETRNKKTVHIIINEKDQYRIYSK